MLFQCDQHLAMNLFKGEYDHHLNSEDDYDPEIPLMKARSKGGTMILWKKSITQYVSIFTDIHSSGFLPLILSFPGLPISIHIAIYLPTAGQDSNFVEVLVGLDACIEKLFEKYPDAVLFIRGDQNVNFKDKNRTTIFQKFCTDWGLLASDIGHNTYHHFVGDEASDSQLDVLLCSRKFKSNEKFEKLFCKFLHPIISSHHDAILSSFTFLKLFPLQMKTILLLQGCRMTE